MREKDKLRQYYDDNHIPIPLSTFRYRVITKKMPMENARHNHKPMGEKWDYTELKNFYNDSWTTIPRNVVRERYKLSGIIDDKLLKDYIPIQKTDEWKYCRGCSQWLTRDKFKTKHRTYSRCHECRWFNS